ncbi:DUF6875 domain-containing protein [Streptomyces chryseus]
MLLTAATTAQQAVLDDWLDNYISRSHPDLGRHGPVCPYVGVARHQGVIQVRAASTPTQAGEPLPRDRLLTAPDAIRTWVTDALWAAIEEFEHHPWPPRARQLHTLIVLLDPLKPEHWQQLDSAHAEIKTIAMRRGLMAGQFHPRCAAPAAHNADFPVNRSPMPLVVIRRMARHDWLFAHQPEHMQAYARRFPTPARPA